MNKHYITVGSEVDCMGGIFRCESYNGSIVWGSMVDYEGNEQDRRLTLSEIALLMHEMDGKNHKVYWEE